MHQNLITYAIEKDITIGQLKQGITSNKDPTPFLQRQQKLNIQGHRYEESDFHYKCKAIHPNITLYYFQGNISLLNKKILAVVGPRKMTPLGEKTVEHLFTIISNYDLVTISGLAPGTDQYAHNLSLQKKIPTIAILGGGIRRFYKHKDRHLLQEIIKQNGLIISEYKPDFVPTRYSFPQRNRLIAGLSDLVFIPEAGEKSGSLITADFAKAMQKPVYGTPNHIYATQHRGLLAHIAEKKIQLCTNLEQMIKKYFFLSKDYETQNKTQNSSLSPSEKEILATFYKKSEQSLNQLASNSNLANQEIITIINILELKDLIQQTSPGTFSIKR